MTDLRAQGLTCESAIEAVSRTFGVTREAARLFVCSHPAWPEEAARLTWVGWRSARALGCGFQDSVVRRANGPAPNRSLSCEH